MIKQAICVTVSLKACTFRLRLPSARPLKSWSWMKTRTCWSSCSHPGRPIASLPPRSLRRSPRRSAWHDFFPTHLLVDMRFFKSTLSKKMNFFEFEIWINYPRDLSFLRNSSTTKLKSGWSKWMPRSTTCPSPMSSGGE